MARQREGLLHISQRKEKRGDKEKKKAEESDVFSRVAATAQKIKKKKRQRLISTTKIQLDGKTKKKQLRSFSLFRKKYEFFWFFFLSEKKMKSIRHTARNKIIVKNGKANA